MKLIWEISRLIQLKWTANSHVFLLLSMDDLWFRKRTLNSVDVDPTYCNLHLLHEAKYTTYLDEHVNLWLILYIRPVAKLLWAHMAISWLIWPLLRGWPFQNQNRGWHLVMSRLARKVTLSALLLHVAEWQLKDFPLLPSSILKPLAHNLPSFQKTPQTSIRFKH